MEFIVLGCDVELAQEAANKTCGVTVIDHKYAGCKFIADDYDCRRAYEQEYRNLFEAKYHFPEGYQGIANASENQVVHVVWGDSRENWEFGLAMRIGSQWYKYSDPNPHAKGLSCAVPIAWQ